MTGSVLIDTGCAWQVMETEVMSITIEMPAEEIAAIKEMTQLDDDADAIVQAAREFMRIVRLRELKAAPTVSEVRPDFPAVGTEAWGSMNRRRAELIRKKNRQALTPEEQSEYETLQRLSQAALEQAFPAPPGDGERVERVEARLGSGRR